MRSCLIALMTLLALVGCQGHRPYPPAEEVEHAYSLEGEPRDAFVKRIAPRMYALTAATNHEYCGLLAINPDGRYGMVIQTIGSQVLCVNDKLPAGFLNTGITVHTHPRIIKELTKTDLKAVGGVHYVMVPMQRELTRFSEIDYENPGYLITYYNVQYQEGTGTERTL